MLQESLILQNQTEENFPQDYQLELGNKRFELKNHLGNVLLTVSDGPVYNSSNKLIVEVKTATDYYPFGMVIPGMDKSSEDYRFGFQGQEVDKEISGSNSHLAFKYRIHDARIGRFLSVDPLSKEYPWNSNYAFAENRVIDGIDLEGKEWSEHNQNGKLTYTVKLKVLNSSDFDFLDIEPIMGSSSKIA